MNLNSAKPLLVMVHGWGLHSAIWQTVHTQLTEKFNLIYIDLPGYGKNHHLEFPAELAKLSEWLLQHVPKKAHYLGWSMGGLITTYFAAHHPDGVLSLINLTTNPHFTASADWPGIEPSVLQQFFINLHNNYKQTLMRFFKTQLHDVPHHQMLISALSPLLFNSMISPNLLTLERGLNLLRYTDLRYTLNDVKCPVLHLLGRLDTLVPNKLAATLKKYYPQHHIKTFIKAAHVPFLSHPHDWINIIYEYIATQ